MLGLNTRMDRHVVCPTHSRMMRVEEQKNGTCHREYRKNPRSPHPVETFTRSLQFNQAYT
jgi:hypothetical protein